MARHNPKEHIFDKEDGTLLLQSNHLGQIVEVNIDKEKRRFYGIKKDGTVIEDSRDCGNDFVQPRILYNIFYQFDNDTWGVVYRIKNEEERKWMVGFKTAREAWLYREALIAGGKAER
ncbi:hypothetical protein [Nostoc sp. 'Peltigera malacea cyanobiont' DB3992]|uniref:hypothetical protein n=1 Tax=Nostoc sp. 'Peltigera malacea cyanobiont' DB3992 TaxID=1206980 RepID=UPI000C04C89B|nr:hypothetical protein [Nostoc sp. 'Peltigera malacea cyanobiont' DB3992]PHM09461.1 hypothetical protein CK516_14465 [Nostoc sp. 'Peltigera malacea cyanobiont' DB3992]